MLLLIVGLHLVLGSIWLMNHDRPLEAGGCFLLGMAATHYGWKKLYRAKQEKQQEER